MPAIRITDPRFLLLPQAQDLFRAAYEQDGFNPQVFDKHPEAFVGLISDLEHNGVFVGIDEANNICALGIVILPSNPLFPIPQAVMFYNDGDASVADEVLRAGVDFVKAAGYNKGWAINASGKSDAVWSRSFKQAGTVSKVGSIMQIDFAET